jgi:glycerophosphoryl diester phosphodiesterase
MVRVGHRGAAGHAPENTLGAIERAIQLGVDFVELDIRRSQDGELVVLHDPRVDRTTDGKGVVTELPVARLREFTIPGGQRIPTLREVLSIAHRRVGLLLEIKAEGISAQAYEQVRAAAFTGTVIYASFFHRELLSVRQADPAARTMALLEAVPVNPTAFAVEAQATHAGIAFECLTSIFVQALHDAGLQVFTYTVNDPADIDHARACAVDGIISDFPERIGT